MLCNNFNVIHSCSPFFLNLFLVEKNTQFCGPYCIIKYHTVYCILIIKGHIEDEGWNNKLEYLTSINSYVLNGECFVMLFRPKNTSYINLVSSYTSNYPSPNGLLAVLTAPPRGQKNPGSSRAVAERDG